MKVNTKAGERRRVIFCLAVLAVAAACVIFSPFSFRSQAETQPKVLSLKNAKPAQSLDNYDIRTDASAEAQNTLEKFRMSAGKNSAVLVFERDKAIPAENALREKVPTLKIERNEDLRIPEIIAPGVKNGRAFLSAATNQKRPDALRSFIKENEDLLGISDAQISQLVQTADYTNPDGNLSFTHLEQKIGGIPVFRGEIKAAFTKRGEIVRVVNNFAPDLDYQNIANDFGNAIDAVKSAAAHINHQLKTEDLNANESASTDLKRVFGRGEWSPTAEEIYFPVEAGVVRAAWRVLIWEKVNAFYVIVDAETGEMLWRKNITEDQTQAATFGVYTNPNAMVNVAHSPFSMSPGALSPSLGTQGAALNRTNITRVGNEAPYAFNNKGWISDGGTETEGNAVEAGIDRDGTDGIDPQGRASGGANRNFVFDYAPGNPNTNAGDVPIPTGAQTYPISAYQMGAVTQLFYICNWYHDEIYRLGFTEAAGNFQTDNFGRGGIGNDRVSAEAQDSSGFNNANFATPADGGRGRMQMFLWNGPSPVFDGDLDADVVIHEHTHGLSNRLHGNSGGLGTNMARAMGEGWSDFYAHAMLSQPSDPINGIYTTGGYVTYLGTPNFTGNNYYGIRRFPKAVMAFTGANGKPHNPLTFRQLNPPCGTEIGTSSAIGTISAFPRGAFGSSTCDQVHAAGEIWSSALWEVRAKFVQRLGWEIGNRKILQLVTDGMKIAPLNPTFLQERDAIIAAAQASGSATETAADVADIWAGFAIRGMGFTASLVSAGGGANNASVTEAFDLPNLAQTPNFTINDSAGNNNGIADPNETILLNIPLTNTTGKTATGVSLQIVGGGSANYGDIANNQTVSRAVSFTVPAGQSCASLMNLTFNINNSFGAKTETRDLLVGNPNASATFVEKFDSVTAPNIPNGWTASPANPNTGSVAVWETSAATPSSAPNAIFAPDPNNVYQAQIESPQIPVNVAAAKLKFKINYNTEAGWDGTTLDIKIGAGAYRDILDAGGKFISGAYPRYIAAGTFPNAARKAWTGNSNGFVTVEVYLPASAMGQTVQFRWNASADTGVAGVGTYIDDVEVVSSYSCSQINLTSKARADFDGDGKTDLSVFRPAEGNWYLNRSRDGFTAVNWGISTDVPTAGDFDGDGKTDVAVWRPSSGIWYVLKSSDGNFQAVQFGKEGDKTAAADYDGDGKTDAAVYRPSTGVWYIQKSRDGFFAVQFGVPTDVPVPADYDGDGKTDIAVYRDGSWIINQSSGGVRYISFGLGTDKPVPADYDGDRKDDVAVYRPSDGIWYISKSSGGVQYTQFGISTDVPVPGDYDGDGRTDIAVYRGGVWYINGSTAGFSTAAFGLQTDAPIPKQYIP
ncbi:MAG: M36 family metallopeptidase [Acidobacteriota bacterium]|nr:M36 family metallopeptidase [Acidobacteriota bacterium]